MASNTDPPLALTRIAKHPQRVAELVEQCLSTRKERKLPTTLKTIFTSMMKHCSPTLANELIGQYLLQHSTAQTTTTSNSIPSPPQSTTNDADITKALDCYGSQLVYPGVTLRDLIETARVASIKKAIEPHSIIRLIITAMSRKEEAGVKAWISHTRNAPARPSQLSSRIRRWLQQHNLQSFEGIIMARQAIQYGKNDLAVLYNLMRYAVETDRILRLMREDSVLSKRVKSMALRVKAKHRPSRQLHSPPYDILYVIIAKLPHAKWSKEVVNHNSYIKQGRKITTLVHCFSLGVLPSLASSTTSMSDLKAVSSSTLLAVHQYLQDKYPGLRSVLEWFGNNYALPAVQGKPVSAATIELEHDTDTSTPLNTLFLPRRNQESPSAIDTDDTNTEDSQSTVETEGSE